MRWSIITASKDKGGLDINHVADTNFTLLCKWLWKFHYEKSSLWKCIIFAKYEHSFIGEIPIKGKYYSLKALALRLSIIEGVDWFLPTKFDGRLIMVSLSFWHGLGMKIALYTYTGPNFLPTQQNKMVQSKTCGTLSPLIGIYI